MYVYIYIYIYIYKGARGGGTIGGSGWDDLLGHSINSIRGWVKEDLQALVKYLRQGGADGTAMDEDVQGNVHELARKVCVCVCVVWMRVCFLYVFCGMAWQCVCVCVLVYLYLCVCSLRKTGYKAEDRMLL
jgi:hypothetical protein